MAHELPTEFLQVNKEVCHVVDDQKRESFRVLQQLFESGQLCDVEIRAGSRLWRCHRVVLAATSAYFRTMFTTNMAESTQDAVTIHDIDEVAMDALITFAYTTSVKITMETVQSLLYAASFLQIESAAKACDDFMIEHLHPSNCIEVLRLAELHCRAELTQAAIEYMLEHFTEVVTTEDFLKIPVDLMEKYISSDFANVDNENQVYEALMLWLKHDVEDRGQWLGRLLSLVRLPLMSMSYLMETVEREELVRQSPQCRDFLDEAKYYQMTQANLVQPGLAPIAPHKTRPRKSYTGVLFVVGGYIGTPDNSLRSLECFDFRRNCWSRLADMRMSRSSVGVCFTGGRLYAIGGAFQRKNLRCGEVYDPKTNLWTPIASMSTHRQGLGVAGLDGQVYAVGGWNSLDHLNTMEKYNPATNQWYAAAAMQTPRFRVSLTVLKGHLYAMGGKSREETLSSCECYGPQFNKWTSIASMNNRRYGASCSTLNDFIYIAGGRQVSSVERYDPKVNQWTLVTTVTSCHGITGLVTLGRQMYAMMGPRIVRFNSVDADNPGIDRSETLKPLQQARAYMGVASCSKVRLRFPQRRATTNQPPSV